MCFVCVEAREKNGEIGKNLIDQKKKRIPSPLVSLKSSLKRALRRRENVRESALLFLEEEAREE